MRAQGFLVGRYQTQILELAVKRRLPVIYTGPRIVEASGFMTYGVDNRDLGRRAAIYVDKILKGRKPADLPIEQSMKFEFIVNLKAAKRIGLTIRPNVLVRADKVIRLTADDAEIKPHSLQLYHEDPKHSSTTIRASSSLDHSATPLFASSKLASVNRVISTTEPLVSCRRTLPCGVL
jgi:ABC transporter substrate binding protein